MLHALDEAGARTYGSSSLQVPVSGVDLVHPHPPMVRLDGNHDDPAHRLELQRFAVRMDPDRLIAFEAWGRRHQPQPGFGDPGGDFFVLMPYPSRGAPPRPLVEEPDGWLPVAPTLIVLGQQIEVESIDAMGQYGPDLDAAIAVCDRAKAEGLPLFWLFA